MNTQENKLKVVHIITGLSVGGAEAMLHKLVTSAAFSRFDNEVVSLTGEGAIGRKIEQHGIAVHALNMTGAWSSPIALLRLRRLLGRLQPDLVQGWMYHGNLAASMSIKKCDRIPLVWNIRQSLYDIRQERVLTRLVVGMGARLSSGVERIVYNSRNAARCHENFGFDSTKTRIIPNGFNTAQYAPGDEARDKMRKSLGMHEEEILIGLIGRYHPMKDHDNFLQAASLLNRKHSNVRFVMAGTQVDGNNAGLKRRVDQMGLAEHTLMLGERNDIPDLMRALDIAVSSSFNEGFSNVIGEAMSSGVPCVVTDVGDSAWIVGAAGRVVPCRDSAALAQALDELVAIGRHERAQLGMQARRRIIEEFSLEAVAEEYVDLYTGILGKG